jgi:pheromone a factor receptor
MGSHLYAAFSFVGFLLCAIPFYWHLQAWNTGTCMYMFWVGLGCLVQCINAILWNNNMIIKATVYCDIVVHIQAALNIAIPVCSLCINRRLYKIATTTTVMVTPAEKRRAIIVDLLIGMGIPCLQMVTQYVVSPYRFNLLEDFGPLDVVDLRWPAIPLFYLWPLMAGIVSLFYCVMTIYHFYRRGRQFSQVMSSNRGLNQSRYFRLMCLSMIEILGTIPLSSYILAANVKAGFGPWVSWADVHSDYGEIAQVPSIVWKSDPMDHALLELYRWSLVACALIFFGFFGFADEARRHYRLVYTTLASRVGLSTSIGKLAGSSNATSSFRGMSTKGGGVSVSVMTISRGQKRDSTISITDQLSIPSIAFPGDLKSDFKIEPYTSSENTASSSVSSLEAGLYDPSSEPNTTSPTPPPASMSPVLPETVRPTIRPTSTYSIDATHAV